MKPGDSIGNFEIVALVGEGAMGEVFHARDKQLHRSVALKVLNPQLFKDSLFVERFVREARSIAQIEHPNIVRIYEFGAQEGRHFMAMEYLTGGSIQDHLEAGTIYEQNAAVTIAVSVASGLSAAHAAGIVHRDIKPDNLMFSGTGEVKIVDLGLARREQEGKALTLAGAVVGTPNYVAPEQVLGAGDINGQADIYSLGITLYHMVTGHPPYESENVHQVLKSHLFKTLPDPRLLAPGLSGEFYEVLLKMTACERPQRLPDMAAVQKALRGLLVVAAPTVNLAAAPVPPTPVAVYSEDQLRLLERQLAHYIGPLAKILVKRSAPQTASYAQLAQRLAEQISGSADRDAFLKSVNA